MAEPFYSYIIEGLPDTPANLEWLLAHFECKQCGRCCRMHTIGLRITHAEAERFAQRQGVSVQEYVVGLVEDRGTYILPQPCRYLVNDACSVHDIKPSVCRKYPFHQRKPVDSDTAWVVIAGCPGSGDILRLIQNGKQLGLEYRPFSKPE